MNRFLITFIFACLVQMAQSQSALSEKFLASKGTWELPVSNGVLKNDNSKNPQPDFVTILSDSSSQVTSVFEGTVKMVDMYDSLFLIIVESGGYFVGYINLATVSVKKDDQINQGDLLGYSGKNLDGDFEVELRVSDGSYELDVLPWFRKDVKQLRSKSVSGDAQVIDKP